MDNEIHLDNKKLLYNMEDIKIKDETNTMKIGKIKCYTDRSKLNKKVGSAFAIYNTDNTVIYNYQIRLDDNCSVFNVELYAFEKTVDYLRENINKEKTRIFFRIYVGITDTHIIK